MDKASYAISLEIENEVLKKALIQISKERTIQPRTYQDIIDGGGVAIPTNAANIAAEALKEIAYGSQSLG